MGRKPWPRKKWCSPTDAKPPTWDYRRTRRNENRGDRFLITRVSTVGISATTGAIQFGGQKHGAGRRFHGSMVSLDGRHAGSWDGGQSGPAVCVAGCAGKPVEEPSVYAFGFGKNEVGAPHRTQHHGG